MISEGKVMVSGTIKIGKLFSWSRNFNVDKDENVLEIIYYPNDTTELHIVPSAASITKLKAIRDQILAIMNTDVTLDGTVAERWELQTVNHPSFQTQEWVKVA
jgi:hypothetical protein